LAFIVIPLILLISIAVPVLAQNSVLQYVFSSFNALSNPSTNVLGTTTLVNTRTSLEELQNKKRSVFLIPTSDPTYQFNGVELLQDPAFKEGYAGVILYYRVADKGWINILEEPLAGTNTSIAIDPARVIRKEDISGNSAVLYAGDTTNSEVRNESKAMLSMIYKGHHLTFTGDVGGDKLIEVARLMVATNQ
jgi:hypothetical protein